MKKITLLLLTVLGIFMAAVPVLAQGGDAATAAANSAVGVKAIAAGVGFAIAVFGGALGQSRIGAAACEGAARNPGAAAKIQTMMILGLALIESLVLFALVISVAFGFLGRRQPKERLKYILWTLLLFLLVGVGIGWAMYPFSR